MSELAYRWFVTAIPGADGALLKLLKIALLYLDDWTFGFESPSAISPRSFKKLHTVLKNISQIHHFNGRRGIEGVHWLMMILRGPPAWFLICLVLQRSLAKDPEFFNILVDRTSPVRRSALKRSLADGRYSPEKVEIRDGFITEYHPSRVHQEYLSTVSDKPPVFHTNTHVMPPITVDGKEFTSLDAFFEGEVTGPWVKHLDMLDREENRLGTRPRRADYFNIQVAVTQRAYEFWRLHDPIALETLPIMSKGMPLYNPTEVPRPAAPHDSDIHKARRLKQAAEAVEIAKTIEATRVAMEEEAAELKARAEEAIKAKRRPHRAKAKGAATKANEAAMAADLAATKAAEAVERIEKERLALETMRKEFEKEKAELQKERVALETVRRKPVPKPAAKPPTGCEYSTLAPGSVMKPFDALEPLEPPTHEEIKQLDLAFREKPAPRNTGVPFLPVTLVATVSPPHVPADEFDISDLEVSSWINMSNLGS